MQWKVECWTILKEFDGSTVGREWNVRDCQRMSEKDWICNRQAERIDHKEVQEQNALHN